MTPKVTVTAVATGATSQVSSVATYGSDVGLPDYHDGNDVYLLDSAYNVSVRIGGQQAHFKDVRVINAGRQGIMATGSETMMGSMGSSTVTIDAAGCKFMARPLLAKDPETGDRVSYVAIGPFMQALRALGVTSSWPARNLVH